MTSANPVPRRFLRLGLVTLGVGVGAGLAGIAIVAVLNVTAWLAFAHQPGQSLLASFEATPPWRRFTALLVAGVVGAVGWYLLRRGDRVRTDEEVVAGARTPAARTTLDALLQMAVIGLGASTGRELAPRQLGALVGAWLSDRTGLSAGERRALVACGAGAGLAAVYDVPLGGAIFALEVLYLGLRTKVIVMALTTSVVSALLGRMLVPDRPLFELTALEATPSLWLWAVIAGPMLGLGGAWFTRTTAWAVRHRPTGTRILWVMPLVFAGVGLLAWPLPAVLGDGGALSTTAFDARTLLVLLALVIAVKLVATLATFAAGAAGGTMTPSVAFGAALGALTGALWSMVWPGTELAAFAVVGAAAFLASAIRAPITAVVLVLEFTGQGLAFSGPVIVAVAGAALVGRLIERTRLTGAY
ncbi:chloride channel protein [Microbacterium sp. GXF7504]